MRGAATDGNQMNADKSGESFHLREPDFYLWRASFFSPFVDIFTVLVFLTRFSPRISFAPVACFASSRYIQPETIAGSMAYQIGLRRQLPCIPSRRQTNGRPLQ
jgi:hypothetical protein